MGATVITLNRIEGNNYWFFVYNDNILIQEPSYVSIGITETMYSVFAGDTEQECLDKIIELNLN